MDVMQINKDIKPQQWMTRIKECRESGLSVKAWCEQNGICQQTYYLWLRKLRVMAVETGTVNPPAFIPVKVEPNKEDSIMISKGDIHIEFPVHSDVDTVMNIMKALLC